MSKNNERNFSTKLQDGALSIDQFGSGFQFKLPGGSETYNTWIGALMSILLFITLIAYGGLQMERLLAFGDTVVTMSVRNAHFSAADLVNDGFSSDEGMKFAFGITAYDGEQESIEDPRYGTVKATLNTWGFAAQGEMSVGGEFETHTCSKEELGLVVGQEDKSEFYPIHTNSRKDTAFYHKKLKCIDENIHIQGDYNSEKAKVLKLSFEKCNNATSDVVCFSDEQITSWLRRKFIIVVQNQQRF